MEVGTDLKSNYKEDEELLNEEEEHTQPMARVETPSLQAPITLTPSNLGKVVPKLIIANPVPLNVPIPYRFLNSKEEEEGEKDILEAVPKVQSMEYQEFVKEDVLEANNPKEVEFDDIGQVITITCNLTKSNIPETFKAVVFVIEFLSEHTGKPPPRISIFFYTDMLLMIQAPTLEFKPLPDHLKYHLPFRDKFHVMGPK
ncbi:S ribonuclease [Pyrus ussuriensis x Pyrus communis]|uniref:S ribonuclease n=1 Tax=Pyrus ussuriensis x Pyrus communis TaxID=2448454 RepID=A0A5N5GR49_9ROSA|nr:S ribonuclease [Pyrus ussuriensis x Pyrus communis]